MSPQPFVADAALVDAALDDPTRLAVVQRILGHGWPSTAVQDCLVGLAEEVGVPFTAATLLDGSEQHFLATNGGPIESCSRDSSHCQYVIASGTFLAINDMGVDPVWRRLLRVAVRGRPIQAYLGVPLKVHGQVLGAVCCVDTSPREEWSTDDQYATYRVARQVSAVLEEALRE